MKIGLTGSIACGKSTVSAYLRETGIPVVDADAISHALTAPGGAFHAFGVASLGGHDVFLVVIVAGQVWPVSLGSLK